MNKKIKKIAIVGIIFVVIFGGLFILRELWENVFIQSGDSQSNIRGIKKQFTKNREYFYYYEKNKIMLNFMGFDNGKPFFTTGSDKNGKMIYQNSFIVKIKNGYARKDLESLNSKFNVSISREMPFTNDEFVLEVNDEIKDNALDMCNKYYFESIIEFCSPNFTTIMPAPEPGGSF